MHSLSTLRHAGGILVAFTILFAWMYGASPPLADTEPLTTAAAVLSLPADLAARHLPVSIRGIVTAAEDDWKKQFFVQDDTGGIFVENLTEAPPAPGDILEIQGTSHPGAFAPIISTPKWRKVGEAPLPHPVKADIERLISGSDDGMRVEVTGIVRAAHPEAGNRLWLDLSIEGHRFQARIHAAAGLSPASLVGARVGVRGTAASHYNAAVRHMTSVVVYASGVDDFTIIRREAADPFTLPAVPANNVAQYHYGTEMGQRFHVRGVVGCQRIGEDIFLQDESGGIRLRTSNTAAYPADTIVDAAGFLAYENYLPYISDADVRTSGESVVFLVKPAVVTLPALRDNIRHCEQITLQGKIIGCSIQPFTRTVSHGVPPLSLTLTTWIVQDGDTTFNVEHETPSDDKALPALHSIPVGSMVEVDGVCLPEIDANGKLLATTLLLPSPVSMRVVSYPSWLTPARLLMGIGLLIIGLVILAGWLFSASRKNSSLKTLINNLEVARHELQAAHEASRKTSEQQFKAVLAERTRLARDLHDTLEQTLTGIALQLDTAARLAPRDSAASAVHLQLARNWLGQSQIELRRSIWDLRSRELEQFDLASALRRSATHLADSAGIRCEVYTKGEAHPLPEIVEENVLRIGQEALTNVARHAQAKHVNITLEYGIGSFRLIVADDGVGFDLARAPGAGEGHFGLTGISERAKRLGGEVRIVSTSALGTSLTVEIPIEIPSPAVVSECRK